MQNNLPKLVTFDGEARSGKGTVVGLVKDYLRDVEGYNVMFIDAGQVFRVLVVAITRAGVDIESPKAIDAYLAKNDNVAACVQLVKDVYHMPKDERDALLYTNEVGVNSAKVGARPLSQTFKDNLLRKWLHDARVEGFEVVLLDGRALEETGEMLEREGLCKYVLGLFFVCDPIVSAQRTLGRMPKPYDELDDDFKKQVDEIVAQIEARNRADSQRAVQPVVMPKDAPRFLVTDVPDEVEDDNPRPMVVIDRSPEVPFDIMAVPTAKLIAHYIL
jgi:cytidylate kinase